MNSPTYRIDATDDRGEFGLGHCVNWKAIASDLFQNRVYAHKLRVRFANILHPSRIRGSAWSAEEDNKLAQAVERQLRERASLSTHRDKVRWTEIATEFNYTRTYQDCYNRWIVIKARVQPQESRKRDRETIEGEQAQQQDAATDANEQAAPPAKRSRHTLPPQEVKYEVESAAKPVVSQQRAPVQCSVEIVNTVERESSHCELPCERDATLRALLDSVSVACNQMIELEADGGANRLFVMDERTGCWLEVRTEEQWSRVAALLLAAPAPTARLRVEA